MYHRRRQSAFGGAKWKSKPPGEIALDRMVVGTVGELARIGDADLGLRGEPPPPPSFIGLTDMLVTNAARFGTEKAQEPLQRVNRAGTHLLGRINQVLDLSKIEAGKLELHPESLNLAPLIDEIIGTARQLAEQNQNRLVVECQESLGPLIVDPMRLRQILLNLLS